jgi:hypothetical protein
LKTSGVPSTYRRLPSSLEVENVYWLALVMFRMPVQVAREINRLGAGRPLGRERRSLKRRSGRRGSPGRGCQRSNQPITPPDPPLATA